jgi:protein-S-isoprenylcysteine O-methyltransferase Ste14
MQTKHILIEILPRAMWIVVGITLYLVHRWLVGSFNITTNVLLQVTGGIIGVFGACLLVWSFKLLAKAMVTKQLITTGLYHYVRHPMYVSMYITLIGVGLLLGSWAWFGVLLLFVPVWYGVAKAEERQMREIVGPAYTEYAQHTGMFFPRNNP